MFVCICVVDDMCVYRDVMVVLQVYLGVEELMGDEDVEEREKRDEVKVAEGIYLSSLDGASRMASRQAS